MLVRLASERLGNCGIDVLPLAGTQNVLTSLASIQALFYEPR